MAYGDLTSLDDVRAWLTPTPPDNDNDLLTRLITAVSDDAHRYMGRFIFSAQYHEVRDGHGGRSMVLAASPVTAIGSFSVDGLPVPMAQNFGAGYNFTSTAITLRSPYVFHRGFQNIDIRYTAGYSAVPPGVAQAVIEWVTLRYRERSREGLHQETVVGVKSETFAVISLTPSITAALDKFRLVAPVAAAAPNFTAVDDPTV